MSTRKLTLSALFIALAAVLSALETMLPPIVPIPGVRVGLGNAVTLFVLYAGGSWRGRDALCISVLRCFCAALITGSLMSAVYGLCGGVLALLAMLGGKRFITPKGSAISDQRYIPFVGVFGARAHITGQLFVAAAFYGGFSVFAYEPMLCVSAVVGGLFTGFCAKLVLAKISPKILDYIRSA